MEQTVVRIEASRGWSALDLASLWKYRELIFILAARDVKVRYKQTALGIAWVVLQPLVAALIFAVVFGRLANMPSDGAPYLLFTFTSLIAWNFFAGTLGRAGNSLVGQAGLITKIWFPRLVIPFSSALGVAVDLVVSLVVLAILLAWYGYSPTWNILALPFFLLLTATIAIGTALWLSALNVYYRDFGYAMPFLVQSWMYATPVVFATSLVPEKWRWLYALNPLVAAVEGTRWAVLGTSALTQQMTIVSTVTALVIFLGGLFFFRRVEQTFADVI